MKKSVVVTGVCGGLGREFCQQLINKNYHVIGLDVRVEELKSLEQENFTGIHCNLLSKKNIEQAINEIIQRHGVPDWWINNAGIVTMDSFINEKMKKFEDVMEVNFMSAIRMIKIILPLMENKGSGKIINISSVAGIVSAPILSSYCASKFAMVGLTESLQEELKMRQSPVKIILVCPGFIQTELINLGSEAGFPISLKPFLTKPEVAVKKIIMGIEKNENFIDPTLNGKVMSIANRFGPKILKNMAAKLAIPDALKQKIKN